MIDLHWRAFQLRPPGSPPLSPEMRARIESALPALKIRAERDYGLPFNPGPLGQNSRDALIVEQYAIAQGVGLAFHDAVMKAYWQRGENIESHDVLQALALSVGLGADAVRQALENPQYVQAVDDDHAQALAYGLGGVPATVLAERYLISGAQPYAVFEETVQKLLAQGL